MYYLVYGFFYLFSLLPWWFIYGFSNGVYGLLYYVIGYRKKLVMANISTVFPEKTLAERTRIAKDFYLGFTDTFLETVKMLSISEKELRKRIVATGTDALEQAFASGQSLQIMGGHFMNWEYANHGTAIQCKVPCLGVYMPLSNKVIGRIMMKLRSRFGTILISATDFKTQFSEYSNKQHALILGADQKPGKVSLSYWLNFFGKPAPFVTGPEKGAKTNNTSVVFANYYRIKRGYYRCDYTLFTTKPQEFSEGAITLHFKDFVEDAIRQNPSCYLWSHNRWKHKWQPEYAKLWIDAKPLPATV